jgi:hypothetical protein
MSKEDIELDEKELSKYIDFVVKEVKNDVMRIRV